MRATRTGQGLVSFGLSYGSARPIAYTPVVTWTSATITTQTGFYLKTPGLLEVWVSFVVSAGSPAAQVNCTIPTGYTAVTLTGSLDIAIGTLCSPGFTSQDMLATSGATTTIKSSGAVVGSPATGTWSIHVTIPTLT